MKLILKNFAVKMVLELMNERVLSLLRKAERAVRMINLAPSPWKISAIGVRPSVLFLDIDPELIFVVDWNRDYEHLWEDFIRMLCTRYHETIDKIMHGKPPYAAWFNGLRRRDVEEIADLILSGEENAAISHLIKKMIQREMKLASAYYAISMKSSSLPMLVFWKNGIRQRINKTVIDEALEEEHAWLKIQALALIEGSFEIQSDGLRKYMSLKDVSPNFPAIWGVFADACRTYFLNLQRYGKSIQDSLSNLIELDSISPHDNNKMYSYVNRIETIGYCLDLLMQRKRLSSFYINHVVKRGRYTKDFIRNVEYVTEYLFNNLKRFWFDYEWIREYKDLVITVSPNSPKIWGR